MPFDVGDMNFEGWIHTLIQMMAQDKDSSHFCVSKCLCMSIYRGIYGSGDNMKDL